MDWNDRASAARAFVKRYGWTFPSALDASGATGNAYGIQGLPTTFVVDRDGRIASELRGPQTAASIEAALHAADR